MASRPERRRRLRKLPADVCGEGYLISRPVLPIDTVGHAQRHPLPIVQLNLELLQMFKFGIRRHGLRRAAMYCARKRPLVRVHPREEGVSHKRTFPIAIWA